MRNLINYILNMIDYCIQEIRYAPSDYRDWKKQRMKQREMGDKIKEILRKHNL